MEIKFDKIFMENLSENIIDSMSIKKDLDDNYFATENCFALVSNLQGETNPYSEFIQYYLNYQDLLPKEIYWYNSTHISFQNAIDDFPYEQMINYRQANQKSSKEIKNSKEFQELYDKYHIEYLRKKYQNEIWYAEMKKILLALKLSIKIAYILQRKRSDVANKYEKINVGFQFPYNYEITIYKTHYVLPNYSQIIKDFLMNSSGTCNKDQRYFYLRYHKLKEIRRIKKMKENSNEMKFSSYEVIENIKILRIQKLKLLKPYLTDGKLRYSSKKEENQSSSNQISSLRNELKMKPSYQTIRILAYIYITYGYNYKIMEKIKYLEKDLKNLYKHYRQQQLRFKSISNMSNRDYSNFNILIVRFSLRQMESFLIDFYKVYDLSRIKYYEFDLIRIMLLKFQEYFHEKLLITWLKVVKLLFELEINIQIPDKYDLIDLYVEIMKKLKNYIYIKIYKGCRVSRRKSKFLASRQFPLTTDNILDYDSEYEIYAKKYSLIPTSVYVFGAFSELKKQKNYKKSFLLDPGSYLEEIYEFIV